MVAVTVAAIVHDLAVEQVVVLVDLPEDDATVTGDTQTVTRCGPLHLCLGEIAAADDCLTEHRAAAKTLLPHRAVVAALLYLLGQCLERMREKFFYLHFTLHFFPGVLDASPSYLSPP